MVKGSLSLISRKNLGQDSSTPGVVLRIFKKLNLNGRFYPRDSLYTPCQKSQDTSRDVIVVTTINTNGNFFHQSVYLSYFIAWRKNHQALTLIFSVFFTCNPDEAEAKKPFLRLTICNISKKKLRCKKDVVRNKRCNALQFQGRVFRLLVFFFIA